MYSYIDTVEDNDQERLRLQKASQNAATSWRFRHLRTAEVTFLQTLVAKVRVFLSKRPSRKGAAARPVRERLSY